MIRIGGGFHEEQAWDSLRHNFDIGIYGSGEGDYGPDPNYYHQWRDIDGVIHETEKAWLIVWKGAELWVAKKLVRGFNSDQTAMFVHNKTFNNIIKTYIENHR